MLFAGVLKDPQIAVSVMGICMNINSAVYSLARGTSGELAPTLLSTPACRSHLFVLNPCHDALSEVASIYRLDLLTAHAGAASTRVSNELGAARPMHAKRAGKPCNLEAIHLKMLCLHLQCGVRPGD